MSKKISKLQYSLFTNQLKNLIEVDIPEIEEELKAAAEQGDLSENSEYDAAKAKLTAANIKKSDLEGLLKYEIVSYDNSQLIVVGSIIKISSPNLPEPRVVMLGDSGNFLTEPVLNTSSPLGKLILGNTTGQYDLGDSIFYVEKITNPDLDEFTKSYLDEDKALSRLFDEQE
ncbi:MAG: hypothetical protein ACRC5M_07275 [Anaeroplasmataceae bacterium]